MVGEAWKKFIAGDDQSFAVLYHAYFSVLFAYALKLGFDKETCKDAIQDIFFKIYVSKKKLTHIQHIEFYLIRSLKNHLFDLHHDEHKIQEINYLDIFVENEKNIVEQIIDKEKETALKHEVSHLLQNLPARQRKIIHYRYEFNLSYVEIGAIMHLSADAVKKNLYRALKKMKDTSTTSTNYILTYLFTILS
ncbi:MAG: sigma-70 family RNA polymerase sigma factor [Proteiniphilum sp.]|jgi:RNA polymerase sigma factor (sigma-70 family)|nr:sigma-70 family RNA polymerase sigma factor [Proteiniphilum sp.]MDD3779556.1 sigma-70 family RNA polymerase sigma factor [Proteiniphilum sp.]MDD3956579.1 sigma-70 family RNA polymerase sigma factor [Proteiniphilum sp.]NCB24485.1 sigma-70 family RNA polymerase sigma factor [Bacteroidia bacterium]